MNIPWKVALENFRKKSGIVVHLTAYGENIETSDVLQRIKNTKKDIMILVGSQKVPSEFFSKNVSDFNVAISNEPHSECSALAVFLDRLFIGKELCNKFSGSKLKIIPQSRGKKVIRFD